MMSLESVANDRLRHMRPGDSSLNDFNSMASVF